MYAHTSTQNSLHRDISIDSIVNQTVAILSPSPCYLASWLHNNILVLLVHLCQEINQQPSQRYYPCRPGGGQLADKLVRGIVLSNRKTSVFRAVFLV